MACGIQIERAHVVAATKIPWAHLRFPPFPHTALRVLKSVSDEHASMRQFSDLVSSDPALSCEVLIIANSALLAHRHPVTSVLQAIVLLGTRTLKGVCLTVAVRAYLGKSMSYPSLRGLWHHSLACALIAEQLADAVVVDKGTAFTSGIVHEIGSFALAVLRPREYASLLENYCGSAVGILESERALFGFDHCEVGRHLITDWKLPAEFENILLPPTPLRHPGDPWHIEDAVQLSCRLADAAGFPAFPGCEVTPYADLMDAMPVRERSLFHADAKRLAFDVGSKITAIESF